MSPSLSRRHFLKAAGLGTAAVASLSAGRALAGGLRQSGIDFTDETLSYNEVYGNPPLLGRVHGASWIRIFEAPSPDADSIRTVYHGYVMPIYRGVRGERYDSRAWSPIWFETNEGYVHSAYVVPCQEIFQEPEDVTGDGWWGEISVPISYQHFRPSLHSRRYDYSWYMGFWGQVHRVIERADDEEGRAWYRLYDDIEPHRQAWVQARHVRRILPEEFAPISPDVQDKRIEIRLEEQTLICYENGSPVFQTRIASGSSFSDDQGIEHDFSTPYGEYKVQRKRPSRRMRGGHDIGLPYDVNGVPWITYFTFTGAAIHGAYWHNNFGRPRSHGCINVTPDAAKWIYRWTQPIVGYEDDYRWTEEGEAATPIIVM